MARSRNFRTLEKENGICYIFSTEEFKKQESKRQHNSLEEGNRITQDQLWQELAQSLNLDPVTGAGTVKKWHNGHNGPNDIELVKDLAKYFGIAYKDLLIKKDTLPQRKEDIVFSISGNDEKSIVIDFHTLLIEFIYNYIGTEDRDSYVDRHYDIEPDEREEEIEDYLFNLYRELEKKAIRISDDVYKKIHRFISECKVFSTVGIDEGTPHLSSLIALNPRWSEINPHLKLVAKYSGAVDFDDALVVMNRKDIQDLTEEFAKEARGRNVGTLLPHDFKRVDVLSGMPYTEKENQDYISFEEHWDYFYFEPYEAVPTELAKTLTMLFKADFPQFFT